MNEGLNYIGIRATTLPTLKISNDRHDEGINRLGQSPTIPHGLVKSTEVGIYQVSQKWLLQPIIAIATKAIQGIVQNPYF